MLKKEKVPQYECTVCRDTCQCQKCYGQGCRDCNWTGLCAICCMVQLVAEDKQREYGYVDKNPKNPKRRR